jgi:signal peptidase I
VSAVIAPAVGAAPAAPPLSGRTGARLGRIAAAVATAVLLAALWWALAPPALGGSTSVVVVDGTSMLPRLHGSDLVLLRTAPRYEVGDVVAYRSAVMGRVVLHRIVAIQGDRYVLKGDNNGFIDPDRPRRADLVGRMWVHVPSAGRVTGHLHNPAVLGGLAMLLVLAVGLGRPART